MPLPIVTEEDAEQPQTISLAEQQEISMAQVCLAIDVINMHIDYLPKGLSLWTIARPGKRRGVVLQRWGDDNREMVHGHED